MEGRPSCGLGGGLSAAGGLALVCLGVHGFLPLFAQLYGAADVKRRGAVGNQLVALQDRGVGALAGFAPLADLTDNRGKRRGLRIIYLDCHIRVHSKGCTFACIRFGDVQIGYRRLSEILQLRGVLQVGRGLQCLLFCCLETGGGRFGRDWSVGMFELDARRFFKFL